MPTKSEENKFDASNIDTYDAFDINNPEHYKQLDMHAFFQILNDKFSDNIENKKKYVELFNKNNSLGKKLTVPSDRDPNIVEVKELPKDSLIGDKVSSSNTTDLINRSVEHDYNQRKKQELFEKFHKNNKDNPVGIYKDNTGTYYNVKGNIVSKKTFDKYIADKNISEDKIIIHGLGSEKGREELGFSGIVVGKGDSTSDSVPLNLKGGTTVIPAKYSDKFKKVYKEYIGKDPDLVKSNNSNSNTNASDGEFIVSPENMAFLINKKADLSFLPQEVLTPKFDPNKADGGIVVDELPPPPPKKSESITLDSGEILELPPSKKKISDTTSLTYATGQKELGSEAPSISSIKATSYTDDRSLSFGATKAIKQDDIDSKRREIRNTLKFDTNKKEAIEKEVDDVNFKISDISKQLKQISSAKNYAPQDQQQQIQQKEDELHKQLDQLIPVSQKNISVAKSYLDKINEKKADLDNITPPSYISGTIKDISLGTADVVKSLGGVNKFLNNVFGQDIPDDSNVLYKLSDNIKNFGDNVNDMPNTMAGNIIGSVASAAPLVVETALLPQTALALPIAMGTNAFGSAYAKTNSFKDAAKEGVVGATEGALFHGLGIGSNKIGQIIAGQESPVMSKSIAATLAAGGFGGVNVTEKYFKGEDVTWNDFAQGAGTGLAFELPGLGKAMYKKAFSDVLSVSPDAVKQAVDVPMSVDEIRDKATELSENAVDIKDPQEKQQAIMTINSLNNTANIKSIAPIIAENPQPFIEDIKNSDLSDAKKQESIDHIQQISIDNDPNNTEAKPIIQKVDYNTSIKQKIENDANMDQTQKKTRIDAINKENEDLQKQLDYVYQKQKYNVDGRYMDKDKFSKHIGQDQFVQDVATGKIDVKIDNDNDMGKLLSDKIEVFKKDKTDVINTQVDHAETEKHLDELADEAKRYKVDTKEFTDKINNKRETIKKNEEEKTKETEKAKVLGAKKEGAKEVTPSSIETNEVTPKNEQNAIKEIGKSKSGIGQYSEVDQGGSISGPSDSNSIVEPKEIQKEVDYVYKNKPYKIERDINTGEITSIKDKSGFEVSPKEFKNISKDIVESLPKEEPKKQEYKVVEQGIIPKVKDVVKKAFRKLEEIFYPSSRLSKKFGEDISAETTKTLLSPDVALHEFNEQYIDKSDRTIDELHKYLEDNYTKEQLRDSNLAYGTPETGNGQKIKEDAINRLKSTEKGQELLVFNDSIRKEISDYVYNLAKKSGFEDINYFQDYFYGSFKGEKTNKDLLINRLQEERLKKQDVYKTTERFTKEKGILSPADASAFGLELSDTNPIDNIKKEAFAISKRAALESIKKDIVDNNRDFAVLKNKYDPNIHPDWVEINDPIFKDYVFHPDFARVVNNSIEVNKLNKNEFTKGLRNLVAAFQGIKFFGSAFHILNIFKASIAARRDKGLIDFGKSISKAIDTKDSIYKDYLTHGGGLKVSKERETLELFKKGYENVSKWALFDNPIAKKLGIPFKWAFGKYNPISPAFAKEMFDKWIPAVKFLGYKADLNKFEKENGRPATTKDKIAIVKRQQEFFGEMNEKLYGRKGTVTSMMRLVFMAPGYGEGNFLHQYRGLKEAKDLGAKGIEGISEQDMSKFKKQWKETGVKNASFVVNSMIASATIAAIGTKLLTGQWPDIPETSNDIRDMFKINTGEKDGNGDDIMIDMMTYDKDAYMVLGNIATGQPNKVTEQVPKRLQGMFSTAFNLSRDLANIVSGQTIYDFKGNPIYNKTDSFHDKLWKFLIYEGLQAEPISASTFKQSSEKGKGIGESILESVVGLRPTTKEDVKDLKAAVSDQYDLKKSKEIANRDINKLYNENPEQAKKEADEFNDKMENKLRELVVKTYKLSNHKEPTKKDIEKEMGKIQTSQYYITKLSKRKEKNGTSFNFDGYKKKRGGKPKVEFSNDDEK